MSRILSACLALVLACTLKAGDSGDAPKVAVLRLFDAINATKTYQARIEVLKKEKAAIDAKAKEFEDAIQKLGNAIEALPQGNEKLGQLQEELDATKARRESFVRRISQDFERRNIILIRDQYQATLQQLAGFCRERGIKIVVQAAEKDVGVRDLMLMNIRIETQTALFWDADQDITDAFIGYVNQHPLEAGAAPPAPPASTPAAPAPGTP
jgi:Skp family chaperone for outer membrane proteins